MSPKQTECKICEDTESELVETGEFEGCCIHCQEGYSVQICEVCHYWEASDSENGMCSDCYGEQVVAWEQEKRYL